MPKEALHDAFGVAVRQVSATGVVVVHLVAEHVLRGGQHGGGLAGRCRCSAAPRAAWIGSVLSDGCRAGIRLSGASPHSRRGVDTGPLMRLRGPQWETASCPRQSRRGSRARPSHRPRAWSSAVGGLAKGVQDLVGPVVDVLHDGSQLVHLRQVQPQTQRPTTASPGSGAVAAYRRRMAAAQPPTRRRMAAFGSLSRTHCSGE